MFATSVTAIAAVLVDGEVSLNRSDPSDIRMVEVKRRTNGVNSQGYAVIKVICKKSRRLSKMGAGQHGGLRRLTHDEQA